MGKIYNYNVSVRYPQIKDSSVGWVEGECSMHGMEFHVLAKNVSNKSYKKQYALGILVGNDIVNLSGWIFEYKPHHIKDEDLFVHYEDILTIADVDSLRLLLDGKLGLREYRDLIKSRGGVMFRHIRSNKNYNMFQTEKGSCFYTYDRDTGIVIYDDRL